MRLAIILALGPIAANLDQCLARLAPLRERGQRLVLIAGAGQDLLPSLHCRADRVVRATGGWARQMNAGARTPEADSADALVFVPDGVCLPPQADRMILRALANSSSPWGRFDIRFRDAGAQPWLALRAAAALANAGSRLTGICTGNQAIFVTRGAFQALEGFTPGEESADTEFSQRARMLGSPIRLREHALVSALVADRRSLLRSLARQELLRLAYALGLSPIALAPFLRRGS